MLWIGRNLYPAVHYYELMSRSDKISLSHLILPSQKNQHQTLFPEKITDIFFTQVHVRGYRRAVDQKASRSQAGTGRERTHRCQEHEQI